MSDDRTKWLDEVFNGDEEALNEYQRAATEEMFHWEDIALSAKVYPDLEEDTKNLIEKRLGYLPHPTITIAFEPHLRALYQLYRLTQIDKEDFYQRADELIKFIRNKDLEPNLCEKYDDLIYQNYRENFFPFISKAKERITQFLGYEPQLQHSLVAEMWLGELLSNKKYVLPNTITIADFKVMTLIKYREVLLLNGKLDADNSPLLGEFI